MLRNSDPEEMSSPRFTVIGISDDRHPYLTPEMLSLISRSSLFSGGRRHHEIMMPWLPENAEWIDVTVPLSGVYEQYRKHEEILVFASGDPLFYGFASTIIREFPDSEVRVLPFFNSLQMLAHRLNIAYQDMRCVSVTGRPWDGLDSAVMGGEALIGALTDRKKTPALIAERMLEYGYDNYSMAIGENLGNSETEHIVEMSLQEAVSYDAAFPNCIILRRTHLRPRSLGIPDSEFELLDGRARMITKSPIRILSLSTLGLQNRRCFWDIGFCTGSISIEAKLLFPSLSVYSFEIRPEGEQLMAVNSRRFGAIGINSFIGDFMEMDVTGLEHPDAVFIGGHGGKMKEMMKKICDVLLPGGVIVFNSVSENSLQLFREAVEECGRKITGSHVIALDDYNPITILKAE